MGLYSVFTLVGVAAGVGCASAITHDTLYPVSCQSDCSSSGTSMSLDLVKGSFEVTTSDSSAHPSYMIIGPATINLHAGYQSSSTTDCNGGKVVADMNDDYFFYCKGVDGNAEGDFELHAGIGNAELSVKGAPQSGDDGIHFTVQLEGGSTWKEVGASFVNLQTEGSEFYFTPKDYGASEGEEQSIIGVWGPAEVEIRQFEMSSGDYVYLKNGDYESGRWKVEGGDAAPSSIIYAPEGLNHIEYYAAETSGSSLAGFDVRVRPAKPLIEVVDGDSYVTIEKYSSSTGNEWDYRSCSTVKSTEYNVNEAATLKFTYDSLVFSVSSDLERDAKDSTCEDDFLSINGEKFCNGVAPSGSFVQLENGTKYLAVGAGDVVEYYSDEKDASDEGRSGWSFVVCPKCPECGYEFEDHMPTESPTTTTVESQHTVPTRPPTTTTKTTESQQTVPPRSPTELSQQTVPPRR